MKPAEVDLALLVNTYHHIEGRVAWFRVVAELVEAGWTDGDGSICFRTRSCG